MPTDFTHEELSQLKKDNDECKKWLAHNGWSEEKWPDIPRVEHVETEVLVEAYPIMGIEKYLGNADKAKRIAFFPQIKMTHDSCKTLTYLKFSQHFKEDVLIVNGKLAELKDVKGMDKMIAQLREWTGLKTHFLMVSETIEKIKAEGKGLGSSASAAGAIATAFAHAVFPQLVNNKRFISVFARYFSGSGTSSVAGGFSIWLSHKDIPTEDSYGVRIDNGNVDVRIVVVPIPSRIKTEEAHGAAEASELYKQWALGKGEKCIRLMDAIKHNDVKTIGEIAELDSLNLFHLFVSGGNMFNWEPETLAVLRKVTLLRKEGLTAYASMDTGPSVAIITTKHEAEQVKREIEQFLHETNIKWPVYFADTAGSPKILPLDQKNILFNHNVLQILKEKRIELSS